MDIDYFWYQTNWVLAPNCVVLKPQYYFYSLEFDYIVLVLNTFEWLKRKEFGELK